MDIRLIGKVYNVVSLEKIAELKSVCMTLFQKVGMAYRGENEEIPLLYTKEYGCRKFDYFVWHHDNYIKYEPCFEVEWKETENGFELCCNVKRSGNLVINHLNRVMIAAYLLCENYFPGEIVCYDKNFFEREIGDKKEEKSEAKRVEELIIPALRLLKKVFPEKTFDNVIDFRTSEALFPFLEKQFEKREDVFNIWEKISLLANPIIQSKKVYEIDGSSMEREDAFELVDNVHSLVKLDEYNHAEDKQYVSLYFFLLCLQKELKKNFTFEGSKEEIEESVICAAHSIRLLRSEGEYSEIEWKKYDLPEQAISRLFTIEWEVIVDTLVYLSKLPKERVIDLTKQEVCSPSEKARKQLSELKANAIRKRLKVEAKQPLEIVKYLKGNTSDKDNFNRNTILDETCFFWEWTDVLEKGMPFGKEYAKHLEKVVSNTKEEDKKVRKDFFYDLLKKLDEKSIYITKKLFLKISDVIECQDEAYAAVLTLDEVLKEDKSFYDFKDTKKYLSFLENREVCKHYLCF